MVNNIGTTLDRTFGALADSTRRAILARLARGEASVSELANPFRISLPAISKHLRVLERAGLLLRRREGRVHRCRLRAQPMKEASDWITYYRGFWEEKLEALAGYLEEAAKGQTTEEGEITEEGETTAEGKTIEEKEETG